MFCPATRYGRSQVCCRQKILVKGLSRLLDKCFNLSPKHGRMVKSCCCVPLVGACSALGHGSKLRHGSERGHGHTGPCSSWTPRVPGWGMAMWQSLCLLELSQTCQEGRPPRQTSSRVSCPAGARSQGSGGRRGRQTVTPGYPVRHSNVLSPPPHVHRGSMSTTVQRCQLLVFLANP